jgi:hypothetical protein
MFSVKEVDFRLKKLSSVDKLVDNGRTISASSMGITAIGTVAGAVLGGVVGIFGGPIGAIAGAQIGAMLGGAAGSLRGTIQVIKNPTYHTEGQVRNEITKYIVNNCNAWRKETPRCLREIKDNLIVNLKNGIEENKAILDSDISHMKDIAESTQKQQMEGKAKYQKIRTEYVTLSKRFSQIIQAKVEDDSQRPQITTSQQTQKTENACEDLTPQNKCEDPQVSYSHLEE